MGGAEGIRTPDPLPARSKFTRAEQRYLGICCCIDGREYLTCTTGLLLLGQRLDSPMAWRAVPMILVVGLVTAEDSSGNQKSYRDLAPT